MWFPRAFVEGINEAVVCLLTLKNRDTNGLSEILDFCVVVYLKIVAQGAVL